MKYFRVISTSFSSKQILGFAANALNYNPVLTNGFPISGNNQ